MQRLGCRSNSWLISLLHHTICLAICRTICISLLLADLHLFIGGQRNWWHRVAPYSLGHLDTFGPYVYQVPTPPGCQQLIRRVQLSRLDGRPVILQSLHP